MILGVLEPTAGRIGIEGVDIARHRSQVVGRTNFAAVYAPLPGNLTVSQNLHIFGLMYGVLAFLNGRNRGHEEVSQERCDVLEKQLLRREAILADKSIPLGCLHTV